MADIFLIRASGARRRSISPKFCAAMAIPCGSTTALSRARISASRSTRRSAGQKQPFSGARSQSPHSWVAEWADLAQKLATLVPVKIKACELPVGFRRLDYLNLADWDGAPRDHKLDLLLDELEQKTGCAPHLDLKAVRACEETWRRFGAPSLKAFALDNPLEVSEGNRKLPESKARVIVSDRNGSSGLSSVSGWRGRSILPPNIRTWCSAS